MRDDSKLLNSGIIFPIDKNIQNIHSVSVKSKPVKKLTKVAFVPNEAENAVIQAGLQKYGLRKAADILRMALRRFADSEGLELKAS